MATAKVEKIKNLGTLTDREYELFKKYEHGGIVASEDKHIIEKYASIGEFRFGLGEEKGRYKRTAILTSLGKDTLDRERIYRSPIKNFFHTVWALIE